MVMHWLFQHNTGKTCVPKSEYDVVYRWFLRKQDECEALQEKLASHDYAQDTATKTIRQLSQENEQLQDQLQEANHLCVVLQAQVDHLHELQVQVEKPAPARSKKMKEVPPA